MNTQLDATNSLEDTLQFHIHHYKREGHWAKHKKRKYFIAAIYTLVAAGISLVFPKYWMFSLSLVFLAILWVLFYEKAVVYKLKGQLSKLKQNFDFEYSFSINEDSLTYESNGKSATLQPTDLLQVIATETHLFLYTSEDNALVLALDQAEDKQAFIQKFIEFTAQFNIPTHYE